MDPHRPDDIDEEEWELVSAHDWLRLSQTRKDELRHTMETRPRGVWSEYVSHGYVMLRKWERCGGGQVVIPLKVYGETPDESGLTEEDLFGDDESENDEPSYSPTSPDYSPESPTYGAAGSSETPSMTPPKAEPVPRGSKRKIVDDDEQMDKRQHTGTTLVEVIDSDDEQVERTTKLLPISADMFATFSNSMVEMEQKLKEKLKVVTEELKDTKCQLELADKSNNVLLANAAKKKEKRREMKAKMLEMQEELEEKTHTIDMLQHGTRVLVNASRVMSNMLCEKSAGQSAPLDDNGCSICMVKVADMVAKDCGHTICSGCVPRLLAMENGEDCPRCRQNHNGFVKIHTSGLKIESGVAE
jgi:hypothetical protein